MKRSLLPRGGEETPYEARETKTEPAPVDVSTRERGSTRALLAAGLQCQKKLKIFWQGVLVWIAAVLVKMSRDEYLLPEWYLKRFGQTHSSRFGGVVP